MQAFDSREINSTNAGHLGGLLQSSTYVAGLSGGGWLVGSIFVNNFTTITDLLDNDASPVWEFGNSIFEGPDKGSIQYVNSEFRFPLLHLVLGIYSLFACFQSTVSSQMSNTDCDAGIQITRLR